MIGKFIRELKRRNVPRAALLYIGAVWALAQGISELAPQFGAPEATTRWFVIAACIGLPFWLFVSWRYELTSQGLMRDSEIPHDAPRDRKSNRRTDLIIIGVLAVAVVLLLTDRLIPEESAPARIATVAATDNSIAVLPFLNQSNDKDQQYFSDGLSEGFIIALSRIKGLRVINRKSSFEFRESKENSQAIAAQLGVSHLLEGSVRRVGDTVRISASLTSATDGSILWSNSYDRPYKDLFALQDQITGQVATALKAQLQPSAPAHSQQGDRPPSGNVDAYNAYMQARSATNLDEAIRLYDLSVQLDREYGLAYSWKARMLLDTLSSGGLSGAEAKEAFAAADMAIQQAMRLAPNQASTRIARGYLLMLRDFDWRGSDAEFKRAVELAPDDGEALFQLGVARASQGDLAQAVDLTRKALKLDPLNVVWDQWLVAYLMPLNRLDEAEQTLGHAIKLKPDLYFNRYLLAVINVLRKDAAGAQRAAEAEPVGPWRDFALALAAQIGSDRAAADSMLNDSINKYSSGWAVQIAQLYAVRGEPDAMFEWLERAWKARDPGMQALLYDALLLRYRDDPRYAALARKVGLPSPRAAALPAASKPPVAPKP